MSGWRQDLRWSPFGVRIHEAKERCRRWLVEKHGPAAFRMLAAILDAAVVRAKELETRRTGKRGALLPIPLAAPTRTQGRQILVPPGYADIARREKAN